MPVSWPDDVDEVLGGDMTAALAYVTPAGGTVVTAVAPCGLRDRDAGHGHLHHLVRPAQEARADRSATRTSRSPTTPASTASPTATQFVLVQGSARPIPATDLDWNENVLGPAAARFMGRSAHRGLLGSLAARVLRRPRAGDRSTWSESWSGRRSTASGEPEVHGSPRPAAPEPAVRAEEGHRAARRRRRRPPASSPASPTCCCPGASPTAIRRWCRCASSERGRRRHPPRAGAAPLPAGGRRAGVLAHSYEANLTGLRSRQHTGLARGRPVRARTPRRASPPPRTRRCCCWPTACWPSGACARPARRARSPPASRPGGLRAW